MRRYDKTFQEEAVALVRRGRSLQDVAKRLGVPFSTVRYWYERDVPKEVRKKKVKGPPPHVAESETLEEKVARLERENAQLRKKTAELEMDKAILKKAAAFFAKESE
jgi:transposase